ncbi:MAG: SRPBCC family protein [Nitrospirales bacterium]
MSEFTEHITISASQERVWAVLADIGRIADWNPGVKHSQQTSVGDVAEGATRRCELGGKNYLDEEVVLFEPYHRMTIRITDSNLPFKSADIRFTIEPSGAHTIVSVSPDYQLKYGWVGRLLDRLMVRAQYHKGMQGLLQGLKTHIEIKPGSEHVVEQAHR